MTLVPALSHAGAEERGRQGVHLWHEPDAVVGGVAGRGSRNESAEIR